MTDTKTEPLGRSIPEAIALASVCCDRDSTSAVLCGVLVETVSDRLVRCVGTNGHALAVVHADGGPEINPPTPRVIDRESIRRAREFARRQPRSHGRLPYRPNLVATWGERSVLLIDRRCDDACSLRFIPGNFPGYRKAYEEGGPETLEQGFLPNTGIDWRYLQLVERLLGQRAARVPTHTKRANIFRSDLDYVLVMPISLPELREVA